MAVDASKLRCVLTGDQVICSDTAVVVVAVLEDCLDPGVSFALMRKLLGLRPYAPGKYFEVF